MAVLPAIIEWARTRPAWQQAALHLLYHQGHLSDADRDYVTSLCLQAHGAGMPVAEPPVLDLGDSDTSANDDVLLLGIQDLHHVSALRESEALTFAETGLTLVYGDNGAGKSSYVRVLKQCCRARGKREPIQGNIYLSETAVPSATLTYRDGAESRAFAWGDGAALPKALTRVSILDSGSAQVYVNDEQDVAYLPHGLDLLPRLAQVCDKVRAALEQHLIPLKAALRIPGVGEGTEVASLLADIGRKAARSRLSSLRGLDPQGNEQLLYLRAEASRLRSEDPARQAADLDLAARRVQSVIQKLAKRRSVLAQEAVDAVRTAREAARAADQVASTASAVLLEHFPLEGLTHATWKALWDAASRFAAHGAHPVQAFPPDAGAPCVLCQQSITPPAADRLAAFQRFLEEEAQAIARQRQDALGALLDPYRRELTVPALDSTLTAELDRNAPGLGAAVADGFELARALCERVIAGDNAAGVVLSEIDLPIERARQVAARLESEAAAFRAIQSQNRLPEVEKAIAELEARQAVERHWDVVASEMERVDKVKRLEKAISSANTRGISTHARELMTQFISQPLEAEFASILDDLSLRHLPISLRPAGARKGTTRHAVVLDTPTRAANKAIFSEGEFRATAIAAFLAEIRQSGNYSTVVFDDPMSSLDLGRREYVAKALLGLATDRPVVVFTHDLVFAWQLVEHSTEAGVAVTERQVRRSGQYAGIVSGMIAASGRPAKERIGPLKNRAVQLRKMYASDPGEYEREARNLYRDLRDTWERGVEDALLNGAVRRFGKEIKTQSLKKLANITASCLDRLEAGMARCSRMSHDQAPDLGLTIPIPDQVEADVRECEAWILETKKLHS